MWFVSVKNYYDMGLYTKNNVKVFVKANMITKADYATITGDAYED